VDRQQQGRAGQRDDQHRKDDRRVEGDQVGEGAQMSLVGVTPRARLRQSARH
jgi:hypothetical protein